LIRLYGTKDGWEQLKELVEAPDVTLDRHSRFTDLTQRSA